MCPFIYMTVDAELDAEEEAQQHLLSPKLTHFSSVTMRLKDVFPLPPSKAECPKVSQSVPKVPKVSQSVPECPKVSQSVPKVPKVSQSVLKFPRVPQRFPKCPRVS